ncbi:MAG: hypothetical protein RL011_2317, partial [Pseudomonadota bacterium]
MSPPFKINTYHTLSTSRIIAGSLNFHKCSQMSIIKLIIALCSYGLSIAATDEGIKTPPLVEAEPISPATAQRYPHLDPYIGNVLLSSSSAHVVLAGVALKPSQARWQPAVLAFFALDSQFGPPIWVRRTAISGIDLSTSPNQLSPNSVYQLALETGVDPGGAGAFARFLYGNKATSKPTMQVTWHLDAGTGHLTYLLESNQNGFNYTTPAWQLRLLGRGKTLIGPTMGRGKFSSSEYMYRYSGTDLISVIGFRGLNFKTDEATIEPAPVQPPLAPPADGVDFDLSIQSGGDRTVARVSALRQCPVISGFKHQLKLHEDFWSALSGCQPAQGMATLTVNRAAGDVQDHVARPLFIFNSEGQAVAYTAVQPHAPSILALPAPGEYHLADSPHGRLIE